MDITRRLLALLLLGWCLAPRPALQAAVDVILEDKITHAMAITQAAYDRGDWEDAIRKARVLAQKIPADHPSRQKALDLMLLANEHKSADLAKQHAVEQKQKNSDDAKQLVIDGSALLEKKEFGPAKEKLERAAELTPNDPEVHYLLASALIGVKDLSGAYMASKSCLERRPDHVDAMFINAELAYKLKRFIEAERVVRKLVADGEQRVEQLRDLRSEQLQASLLDKAAASGRKLESLRVRLARANYLRGLLAVRRHAWADAREAFAACLKQAPGSLDLHQQLGMVEYRLGRYHQASLALEQALLIGETRVREIKTQAKKLLDEGKSDDAVNLGLKQKDLEKKVAGLHFLTALCAWKKSDNTGALNAIDRALKLKPDLVKARFARALFRANQHDYPAALHELREVLKQSEPGGPQAKVCIQAIKDIMDRSAPGAAMGWERVSSGPVEVGYATSVLVKDLPGMGGRRREDEWQDILPRFREIQNFIDRENLPQAVDGLMKLIHEHPAVPHATTNPDHYYTPHGHTTLAPSYLPQAHTLLANCYLRMGRLEDARVNFQTAIKLHEAAAEPKSGLAYVFALQGKRLPEALQLADAAIAAEPDRADFHHTRGWVMFRMGEVEKAVDSLQRALNLDPNHKLARYNLGLAQYHAGRLKEALACLEAVLMKEPDNEKAALFRALTLAKLGEQSRAVTALEDLEKKLPPEDVTAKVVERLKSRFKLAIERQMALPVPPLKHPANLEPLLAKARIYRQQGLVNRAKELYLECQRLIPTAFAPYYELGALYAENGLHRPAIRIWEQALKLNPNDFNLQLSFGKIYHHLHDRQQATEYFARAQALNPTHPEAFYYLGLLAFEQNQYLQAESYARAALRVNTKYMKARALLGVSLIHRRLYRKARDEFEHLYAKAPPGSSIQRLARKKLWELAKLMQPNGLPSDGHLQQVVAAMEDKEKQAAAARITPNEIVTAGPPQAGGRLSEQEKLSLLKEIGSFKNAKTFYSVNAPPPPPSNLRLQTLKRARPDDPADDKLRDALGLVERGFLDQGLAMMIEARRLSENNLELLFSLGYLHTLRGNFSDAFHAFAVAAERFPADPLPAIALGNLYWLGGHAENAAKSWQRAAGKTVQIHKELNVLARSEKVWQKMLSVNPTDPDAHSQMGLILLFSGRSPEAIAEFEGVLRLAPERREHRFYVAEAQAQRYFIANNEALKKQAKAILDDLNRQSPPFPHAANLLAYLQRM